MPDNEPYGDLSILEREVLAAVQQPGRVQAVTDRVNERVPSLLCVTRRAVVKALCDLHDRGLVLQQRGGWWHRTRQGQMQQCRYCGGFYSRQTAEDHVDCEECGARSLAEQAAAVHSTTACEPQPRPPAES